MTYEPEILDNSVMKIQSNINLESVDEKDVNEKAEEPKKASWNNSIEFLMSCVALSVGFGNIWRFPFTAYENGGGAFLIPYVILLILVGKPFYYLEMIIGQFSGNSSIKVWKISPGFAGNLHKQNKN